MNANNIDFGMVGLGVMGRNLLLNIAEKGYSVIGLDRDAEKVAAIESEHAEDTLHATTSVTGFISALKRPRTIMMLVPAGSAVDAVTDQLLPHLGEDDLLMDGGNSYFPDTDRRYDALSKKGIHYMGVGISGGEEGARHGPSIMPGGSHEGYQIARPILESAAAKVDGEPCVTFVGNRSAGNYVKMVHNGIEYALMQLIAEAYHFMKSVIKLSDGEIRQVLENWNSGPLGSYLMEITADIFARMDDDGSTLLLNRILDSARQKGTGKWTSQNAMDLQVPTPTLDMAVMVRNISAHKAERVAAESVFSHPSHTVETDAETFIPKLRNAIHFSFITAFAQGFALISKASAEYGYDVNLADVARIWRGGCIIRADMLEDFRRVFTENPPIENMMVDAEIAQRLSAFSSDARDCITAGIKAQVPLPALSASVSYFDLYKSGWLPVNLIQAQRDYFGAHTYERTDKEGAFHTNWKETLAR
jgi:6-phosphogluconate dehydrogenase